MSRILCVLLCSLMLVPIAMGQTVSFYQTTPDLSQKLQKQSDLTFDASGSASVTITVDDSKTYQQIDGFGASFTDSSAWLVYKKLSEEQRSDAMQKLFDRTNGIALSFIRQPMGASDLALNFYSYDDNGGQADPTLANFSIAHDKDYIIPVLKQALALNPNIKMMANPWSPPAWMKTNNSLLGKYNGVEGHLKADAFEPLAQYFVKYIQAYEAEGIPTHYISMQNEPQYAPEGYTGLILSAQDEINLLVNNIGPAFSKAGIKTKVMVWDHNWDNIGYAMTILKDPNARALAAGSAWHHYAGDPSAMSVVHDAYPDKDVWETEASGGTWNGGAAFPNLPRELINSMRNWARSYVLWNMVLDQNRGPVAKTPDGKHGCDTCRGLLTVTWQDGSASSFNTEADYYVLGHASKFLMPGAYRIASDMNTSTGLYNVAFRNPDGSIVVYLFNNGTGDQKFNVKQGGKFFTATVKAGSLATFVWSPTTSPVVALSHSPNGLSLKPGQAGSIDLTVSPLTGTPSVALGCQVLGVSGSVSTSMACQVDNPNLAFSDNTPQNTTVTIKPSSAAASTLKNGNSEWALSVFGVLAGLPVLGVVAGCGSKKRRSAATMLLVVIAAGTLISCGGGGGGSTPTPTPVTPTAATPVMSPSSTTFSDSLSVTLTSATPGATIYYTLDGTPPSQSSTKYTGPINLTAPATVKAIAVASGYENSLTGTAAYTMAYTLVVTGTTDTGAPVGLTVPVALN